MQREGGVRQNEVTSRNTPGVIGKHLLVDMHGVSGPLLADEARLERILLDALAAARMNVIEHRTHKFPGVESGVTAVFLLAESHASIHTYPECSYAAIDIFSCGADPQIVLQTLQAQLQPSAVRTKLQLRGTAKPFAE